MENNDNIQTKKLKSSSVFWGILFVSLGVGLLLQRNSIVNFQNIYFSSIWSILLIFIGIAFLNIPRFIKLILSGLSAIIISIFILSIISNIHFGNWHFFEGHEKKGRISNTCNVISADKLLDSTNLVIQAGAVELDISSINTQAIKFASADLQANFSLNYDSTFKNYELKCKPKSLKSIDGGFTGDLQLNDSTIWNINAELGATEFNANFKDIKIGRLILNSGASNIDLQFGNKHKETEIVIESGASNIEISIPYDADCEIYSNTALSSADFDEFEEINSGYYRSTNSANSSHKFIITISGGVSNFQINRIK